MKVVFVGPTLPDAANHVANDVQIRPPAIQGDIMRAFEDGAEVIGLIDGQFEYVAPVWHKELLYVLSKGVTVMGAASMGALRAAECAAYGMIGIGTIFEDYRSGRRIDDADVALVHAPAELRYAALTVPMVNIEATMADLRDNGLLTDEQAGAMIVAARSIHYKDRTWKRIGEEYRVSLDIINSIISRGTTDQKRTDALALLSCLNGPVAAQKPRENWIFNPTPLWRKLYPSHDI